MSTNYYARKVIQFPLSFTVNSSDDLEELTEKVKELQSSVHLGKRSEGWNLI
jgi:flagellar basal body-associated protein FliL